MTAQTDIEARWTAYAADFTAVVDQVTDWHAQTPCTEWDAAQLLEHMVTSQRDFAAANGREVPIFDGSRSMDRRVQWIKHTAAMEALAGDPSFINQTMSTALGQSTVGDALLRFHGFDLVVHRWDLGRSQGIDVQFTDVEMDRLEATLDAFGDRAYTPGILAEPVQVPEDASRQERLLARMGRRA